MPKHVMSMPSHLTVLNIISLKNVCVFRILFVKCKNEYQFELSVYQIKFLLSFFNVSFFFKSFQSIFCFFCIITDLIKTETYSIITIKSCSLLKYILFFFFFELAWLNAMQFG